MNLSRETPKSWRFISVLRGRFTTCARDDCTWQVYNVCSGCLCLGRFWGLCLERFLGRCLERFLGLCLGRFLGRCLGRFLGLCLGRFLGRCLGRFLGLCLGYSLGLCLGWFIMSEVSLHRCTTCARGARHVFFEEYARISLHDWCIRVLFFSPQPESKSTCCRIKFTFFTEALSPPS